MSVFNYKYSDYNKLKINKTNNIINQKTNILLKRVF